MDVTLDDTVRRILERLERLEQKIDGDQDLQLVGLNAKMAAFQGDVVRIETSLNSLTQWRSQMLTYIKVAIAVSALGSIGGLNEILKVLTMVIGG